jgi:glycerol kinase
MPHPRRADAVPLYLCIDQGGHASRALVYDARGRQVAAAHREVRLRVHADGRMDYDARELLDSVTAAIDAVIAELGGARRRLIAAGLATQRSNVACWDMESGAALSPVISWQDRRAARRVERLRDRAAQVHRVTGLPLSAHYGASKLHWCLAHLPPVAAALAAGSLAWGPMASFLLFHLARERPLHADPVNAARTQLWDLAAGDWSESMLELFELPRAPLPRPAPNCHAFGTLDRGDPALPLAVVTGDQNAALFAGGRPAADVYYVTVGTGAFVLRLTDGERPASHRLLHGVVHKDRDATRYALEGTVNGAASALDWLAARHPREDLVAGLHGWLAEIADPPLFLNGVSGLGTPFMQPHFESRFHGAGGPAQQAVAVVESIAFQLQLNIEEIGRLRPPASRIEIGGGLSRYDGLCRRLADLSGLPVRRGGRVETTGRGLAYLLHAAAVDDGAELPWEDEPLPDARTFLPRDNAALSARYLRWRTALREALRA